MKVLVSSLSATVYLLSALLLAPFALAHDHEKELAIPDELAQVYNIHRPTAEHYSSGQPTREELSAFADAGVINLINLRPPSETQDFNPAAWASEETIAYYQIPIAGGADLTPDHVATFDAIVNRVAGEQTLMHCGSGNRVGAMMALRAVWHQQADLEQAIELGKSYGLTSLESHVREQVAAHQ